MSIVGTVLSGLNREVVSLGGSIVIALYEMVLILGLIS